MTDCIVTTPETRPEVLVTTLDRDDLACSRCEYTCGPIGGWAFVVSGYAVCPHCITEGEVADVEVFETPQPGRPCLIRGAHLVEHPPEEECPGCLPGQAAPDSRVCLWHQDITRDYLKGATPGPGRDRPRTIPSLAELYETLGLTPTGTERGGGDAQAISDDRRNARSAIKAMLVSWALTLAESPSAGGRGLTVPDEKEVKRHTALAIFQAEADMLTFETDASEEPDPGKAAILRQRADYSRLTANLLREQYDSGADVIAALCEHLDRHLQWLLNSDHADQVVNDVANAWRWAWGLAGSGRNIPTLLCECGTRVPMPLSEDSIERETQEFVCPGCGNWGVLAWWAQRLTADPDPMRIVDLVPWLAHWHGIVVTERQLRNWADRGDITPKEGGGKHGVTRRFDPVAVALVAAYRIGVSERPQEVRSA